jgi:hypothetical protein
MFSAHVPIHIDLKCFCLENENINEPVIVKKIKWENDRNDIFRECISSDLSSIETIVNDVIDNNLSLDSGNDSISAILYKNTYDIFGVTKVVKTFKYRRKFKSQWLDQNCERERKNFVHANRLYLNCRSALNK